MFTNAQMAELVDALVSNTNVFGRAGSIPALGTSVVSTQKRSAKAGLFLFEHCENKMVGAVYPDIA